MSRFILFETAEGKSLLSRIGATDHSWPIVRDRLEHPALASVRTELEVKLKRIERRFGLLRKSDESRPLEIDESLLLRSMASRELRFNPEWSLDAAERGPIPFFESETRRGLRAAEAEFRAGGEHDPAFERIEPLTRRQAISARRKLENYLERMRGCRAGLGPEQMQLSKLKYTLRQLAVDEVMLLGGAAIVGAGSGVVEWKNLPSDLLFEAISSVAGSRLALMPGPLHIRWIRLGGAFGIAQSTTDAVIYYLSPLKETHGRSDADATIARFKYNASFEAASAPIHIALSELFLGLDCLHPTGGGHMAVLGLQLGAGLGIDVAYFGIRGAVMGAKGSD